MLGEKKIKFFKIQQYKQISLLEVTIQQLESLVGTLRFAHPTKTLESRNYKNKL